MNLTIHPSETQGLFRPEPICVTTVYDADYERRSAYLATESWPNDVLVAFSFFQDADEHLTRDGDIFTVTFENASATYRIVARDQLTETLTCRLERGQVDRPAPGVNDG